VDELASLTGRITGAATDTLTRDTEQWLHVAVRGGHCAVQRTGELTWGGNYISHTGHLSFPIHLHTGVGCVAAARVPLCSAGWQCLTVSVSGCDLQCSDSDPCEPGVTHAGPFQPPPAALTLLHLTESRVCCSPPADDAEAADAFLRIVASTAEVRDP
jgi:hypothetical protein